MRAAAITGFGVVCAVGNSVADAWPRVLRGERGLGPLTLFDGTGQRTSLAAEVKGLAVPSDPDQIWSRSDAMALSAAAEALRGAGLDPRRARVGLVVGGTTSGMLETEELLARMHADPALRVPTPGMIAHPLSATVDRLGAALGPFRRARTVCSACSSGANAFAVGLSWLALGEVDAVLVGGTDGLCRLTFTGFNALAAIDPGPCRPFDARRRGLNIGEGAGFCVLERPELARARGASFAATLVGVGVTSEAHHITNPAEDGAMPAEAIRRALAAADVSASRVGYVNAHGTATPLNDAMETRALASALGDHVGAAWVSSTKAVTGHTLAAAGAIEAVFTALSVRDGVLPPTVGLEEIDPKCAALRHVVGDPVRADVAVALSDSFGFGGVDTVLALARADEAAALAVGRRAVYVHGLGTASRLGAVRGTENLALLGDARPAIDPLTGLDPAKSRRFDRHARLATVALAAAGAGDGDGAFLGTAYGDPDASAAFLARVIEKGPRLAPPADFPNLVPSSPAGHASIYLGLRGPVMAVADLSASGEAALATAFEWIAAGLADAACAGSVEGPSVIAETCLAPQFRALEGLIRPSERSDGAAVARLASAPSTVLLRHVAEGADAAALVAALPAPSARACVVVPEVGPEVEAALAGTGWAAVPRVDVVRAIGRNEGAGGFAFVAACARVEAGEVDEALVLAVPRGRAYLLLVGAA